MRARVAPGRAPDADRLPDEDCGRDGPSCGDENERDAGGERRVEFDRKREDGEHGRDDGADRDGVAAGNRERQFAPPMAGEVARAAVSIEIEIEGRGRRKPGRLCHHHRRRCLRRRGLPSGKIDRQRRQWRRRRGGHRRNRDQRRGRRNRSPRLRPAVDYRIDGWHGRKRRALGLRHVAARQRRKQARHVAGLDPDAGPDPRHLHLPLEQALADKTRQPAEIERSQLGSVDMDIPLVELPARVPARRHWASSIPPPLRSHIGRQPATRGFKSCQNRGESVRSACLRPVPGRSLPHGEERLPGASRTMGRPPPSRRDLRLRMRRGTDFRGLAGSAGYRCA